MGLDFARYLHDRAEFSVTQVQANAALAHVQPLAVEALGVQIARHVMWDGELPAHVLMSSLEDAGMGELMPMWFDPSARPVPLFCLENWGLFAGLYRTAFGQDTDTRLFTVDGLLQVMFGSCLLIPFLPGTQGSGRFVQNGALTLLLGILWLDEPARTDWLEMHAQGARRLARSLPRFSDQTALDSWLWETEMTAFLVPERSRIAGDEAVKAFLDDPERVHDYQRLFECLCLTVTALHQHYGSDWRSWIFQALNVHYPITGFGLEAIAGWLDSNISK